jgi:phosphofructokinase-like protein
MTLIQRIGVTTGGGDAPGLNAVIRAVVKVSRQHYHWEVFGIEDGFDGLLAPDRLRTLTPKDVSGILHRGGTILGTINRGNPFKHTTVKDGQEVMEDITPQLIENIKTVGLDAIVCIGGDGTLSIARDLHRLGISIVGVPKTIDNDLCGTEYTFGFNTAVSTATEALDKLHTTAESHHRVMVMEVMGRDAGWIALEAGIAGGADVILIPEIQFKMDEVARKIKQRAMMGSKFSIVVVAEGAKTEGGEKVLLEGPTDNYAVERLGGIGQWVAKKITEITRMDTRVTVLGHLQRGGSPTTFDRLLATRFGVAAVELVAQEKFGMMVCLKGGEISSMPLEEALCNLKRVEPDGQMVRAAEMLGIEFGR